ncbi:hypothetical protein [Streptomyces roseoverticillatus]|uniref:hypothetical protein n=1 Tax=Streptomyces roseoverticillatus TaxID=66429 RepID=UPI0004C10B89|nr:hypothetical protein [Streptomyces roseoverticillatus]
MHDRVGDQLTRQQLGAGDQISQLVGGEHGTDGAARDGKGAGIVRHAQPVFERLDLRSNGGLWSRQEHVASGGVG